MLLVIRQSWSETGEEILAAGEKSPAALFSDTRLLQPAKQFPAISSCAAQRLAIKGRRDGLSDRPRCDTWSVMPPPCPQVSQCAGAALTCVPAISGRPA